MTGQQWLTAVVLVAVLGARVDADVWDIETDNGPQSSNELVHGTNQVHDLGVRPGPAVDTDWYKMPQKPYASYEIVVDGLTAGLGFFGIERMGVGPGGVPGAVEQTAVSAVTGALIGPTRALRWVNNMPATVHGWVRVSGAACGTTCDSSDVYTIGLRETTVNVPRFNAAGTQTTVLLIQNACERPVSVSVYYWSVAGSLLHANTLTLAPKALSVQNVATAFPILLGQSGSITVAHDGGYGALVAKTVALEPATGFSFDTPGVYVPN